MLTRLSLIVGFSIAFCAMRPASATPITYAFTGSLARSINGTNQISGALTLNGDPTLVGGSFSGFTYGVNESGGDVSLTLTVGGQKFNIENIPDSMRSADPYTHVSFQAGRSPSWTLIPTGPAQDEAIISAGKLSTDPVANFGMGITFYSPSASNDLGNLRHFSFPIGTSSIYLSGMLDGVDITGIGGQITSFELVPTPIPEPGTLAVFVVLGTVTVMACRRRRS